MNTTPTSSSSGQARPDLTLAASLVSGVSRRSSSTGRPQAPTRRAPRWSTPAASRCSKTSTWPADSSRRASRRRGSPSATAARTLVPIDFAALPTEYPYTLMAPQSTTERLLLDRLIELGG